MSIPSYSLQGGSSEAKSGDVRTDSAVSVGGINYTASGAGALGMTPTQTIAAGVALVALFYFISKKRG